jgi:nucleoid DNA-binding protein
MDKPISMSVKDYLIRTLAVKILTSEKTIEAVVNHQFQSANEAMDLNNSIEIAGFGKLFFNNKKAIKKLGQLNAKKGAMEKIIADETITEQKKKSAQVTLKQTVEKIESINQRITYED